VRLRSSLPDKHDPASRAIKACVGKRSPRCLAKSALLVSKRSQRVKRSSTILNDEGQGRRKPGGDPGCGRMKRLHAGIMGRSQLDRLIAQLLWRPQAGEGECPGQAKSPAPQEDFQLFIAAPRAAERASAAGGGVFCPQRSADPGAGSQRRMGLGGCPVGGGRGERRVTFARPFLQISQHSDDLPSLRAIVLWPSFYIGYVLNLCRKLIYCDWPPLAGLIYEWTRGDGGDGSMVRGESTLRKTIGDSYQVKTRNPN
jgi:hypothetical protein